MCINVYIDHTPRGALFAKQIATVDRLQRRLGHTDGGRMDFGCAIIVLGSTLPHAIVGRSVGALHVVDQVLNESHLILESKKKTKINLNKRFEIILNPNLCVNDLQSRCDHLYQKYYVDRYHVDLQVIVQIVRVNLLASVQMEFTMQCVGIGLTLFEQLYAMCLFDPTLENTAHAFHRGLAELVRFAAIVVDSS